MQEEISQNGTVDPVSLKQSIIDWAHQLGFQDIRISNAETDISSVEAGLSAWLAMGFHGDMDYMAKHGTKRTRPNELVPGVSRVISVRMNYLPSDSQESWGVIKDSRKAFISRYALGRDYHKVMRGRLQKLVEKMEAAIGTFNYRVFSDSAPVMEVEWASKSGLGWRGKHTLLLSREAGSFFFLAEIYTDLPLPIDEPIKSYCGSCTRCLEVCPTNAIVAPYQLDARRCISYLTIELKGSIPETLRPLIGNRVYGCDDCQLICPWNKFAKPTQEPDFAVRNGLDNSSLIELFAWTQDEFETRLAGSPIRRIGYQQWLRNLAVGLGNAPTSPSVIQALKHRSNDPSALVQEHVHWALKQHSAT